MPMNPLNEATLVVPHGNASDDTEGPRTSQNEKRFDDSMPLLQQSISSWKWYSICVGLYLTALLYGMAMA